MYLKFSEGGALKKISDAKDTPFENIKKLKKGGIPSDMVELLPFWIYSKYTSLTREMIQVFSLELEERAEHAQIRV